MRLGTAWQGKDCSDRQNRTQVITEDGVGLGGAGLGMARHGAVRSGLARHGAAGRGAAR